jgi:hypothetical protein
VLLEDGLLGFGGQAHGSPELLILSQPSCNYFRIRIVPQS